MTSLRVLAAGAALGVFLVCPLSAQPNQLTAEEKAAGWKLLFDGRSTAGWREYRKPGMPAGWQVVDGELRRVREAADIITVEQYESFELALDWKIAPGGNSGIFFHVVEDSALSYVYESGPEMQILDDQAHQDGLRPETSAGSNYALHARAKNVVRPPGEWNSARLLVRGSHVEHWLNGEKLLEYELGSDDWWRRVNASKFKDMPQYGRARRGHIALQEHGGEVSFRNIRLRVLPKDVP